jgi:3-dehydroquinate dehydratase/shikimate dehydrogenase
VAEGIASTSSRTSTLICTSLTAPSVAGMLAEAGEAVAAGADIVELRVDFLQGFVPTTDLPALLQACPLPVIVTYRPEWEG